MYDHKKENVEINEMYFLMLPWKIICSRGYIKNSGLVFFLFHIAIQVWIMLPFASSVIILLNALPCSQVTNTSV